MNEKRKDQVGGCQALNTFHCAAFMQRLTGLLVLLGIEYRLGDAESPVHEVAASAGVGSDEAGTCIYSQRQPHLPRNEFYWAKQC